MALLRKLCFLKPPDGLLEIAERVYVFDSCFTTHAIKEENYSEYISGVIGQLQEHFPDALLLVLNFGEQESQNKMADIFSKYDITIMDYPRHYEGCPVLTVELVQHFLRSSESWLSLGQQNVLLMHCERNAWPVLAFMLAALLLYRKHYIGEQRTLDMVYRQAPRELLQLLTPMNSIPSQLRYLQYISRRDVAIEWPPLGRCLNLDCIILKSIPNFDGEGCCRLMLRICGPEPFSVSDRTAKVLFSTAKRSKAVRAYKQSECELVKIDISCHIQCDVVVECVSLNDDMEGEEMVFRLMFNTAFIRSNILIIDRDEIDTIWNAKDRFPKDFRAEILFSEIDDSASIIAGHIFEEEGLPIEAFVQVQEMFSHVDWLDPKADAALHILQQISASSIGNEMLDIDSHRSQQTTSLVQDKNLKTLQEEKKTTILENDTDSQEKIQFPASAKQYPGTVVTERETRPQSSWGQVTPQLCDHSNVAQKIPQSSQSTAVCNSVQVSDVPKPADKNAPAFCTEPSLPDCSVSETAIVSCSIPDVVATPDSNSVMLGAQQSEDTKTVPKKLPPPPPLRPCCLSSSKHTQTLLTKRTETCHQDGNQLLKVGLPVALTTPLSSATSSNFIPIPPAPTISSSTQHSLTTPPAPPTRPPPLAPLLKEHVVVRPMPSPPPPPPLPSSIVKELTTSSPILLPPPPPSEQGGDLKTSSPAPPPPPPLPPGSSFALPSPPLPSNINALPVPSASPPPAPLATGTSKTGDAFPGALNRKSSTGSTPPGPPPFVSPPSAKARSLSRTLSSKGHITKKLKPLHWLKLTRAVQGSLWAETPKSGEAAKAPEIDMSELESLFSAAVPSSDHSKKSRAHVSVVPKTEKVQLIDHRRAYNCEIMLSKVKVPLHDLMSSVLALEDSAMDADQVENLIKFCPTKEEMELLKGYTGEREKLGKCEQFFLELMRVPRAESKIRVFSFKMQFCSQVSDLRNSLSVAKSAAEEIRKSFKLKRIMQTILSLGNALNQGTARGSAIGFRLDSLLKLTETRARNNKMTLMHYLCKVLTDKLPEVLDFSKDLPSLEPASKIQLKMLAEEMKAVSKGLEKVVQELSISENDGPVSENFRKTLKEFLRFAEAEARSLASLYSPVGRNVDALISYFGEDPARCPFEQVISTLLNFERMFNRAHEENSKQLELEMKKTADSEKLKTGVSHKEDENLLHTPIRSSDVK